MSNVQQARARRDAWTEEDGCPICGHPFRSDSCPHGEQQALKRLDEDVIEAMLAGVSQQGQPQPLPQGDMCNLSKLQICMSQGEHAPVSVAGNQAVNLPLMVGSDNQRIGVQLLCGRCGLVYWKPGGG